MNIPKGKLFALVAVFAAIGLVTATGAFTTVTAERTADVSVAGDSNALLAISQTGNPNSAEYFSQSGGTAQLDLSSGAGGQGVNLRATTAVEQVFKITNQGSQEVAVTITTFDDLSDVNENTAENGAVRFALHGPNVSAINSPTQTGIGFDDGQEVTISNSTSPDWDDKSVVLDTGESIYVSLYIDTSDGDFGQEIGDSVYTDELANNPNNEDLLDQITIHASAEETENAGWARDNN